MNKLKTLLVFAAAFVLAACNGGNETTPAQTTAPAVSAPVEAAASSASAAHDDHHHASDGHDHHADEHNAANSLDWAGTYQGELPCADCAQIAVTLVLKDDMSYDLSMDYQGGKEQLKEQESGKFAWEDEGKIIKLDGKNNPMRLFVAEGHLQQLADDAKAYDAKNSKYNLKKQ